MTTSACQKTLTKAASKNGQIDDEAQNRGAAAHDDGHVIKHF
jgi:hypothetical protein